MQPDRYRRQKLLPWLNDESQKRLGESSVLIARVGGLGGPLVQSLAMAGVGRIVFFHDGDLLEEDRHRMVLMSPDGVGRPRAPQAEESLRRLGSPHVEVQGFETRITAADATKWMTEVDLAIGAAPTFEERFTLNDAALASGKPFVDAAMYGDEAQLLCVKPGESACLRCLIPETPPWRDDFPVLAAVSAMIGNLAAFYCVRILARAPSVPWGEFHHWSMTPLRMTQTYIEPRENCPACASAQASRACAGRLPPGGSQ